MSGVDALRVLDTVARGCALHADRCVGATQDKWIQACTDDYDEARAAVADLLATGTALVERWDTPLWKDVPHTAEFIHALRDAIAKATSA